MPGGGNDIRCFPPLSLTDGLIQSGPYMHENPTRYREHALSPATRVLVIHAARFFVVGLLTTGVTFFSFVALYRWAGVNEYASNMASYILGLINSYFWNKVWTFKSEGFNVTEVAAFLVVFGVSYGVQLGGFTFLRMIGTQAEYAQVLAMFPYTVVNFIGNKYITFGNKKPLSAAQEAAHPGRAAKNGRYV